MSLMDTSADTFNDRARFGPKPGDEKKFVVFYSRAVLDGVASRDQNRPVHARIDYVKMQNPGERDCLDRPANDEDRARFPRQWEAYQKGLQNEPDGTLLAVLFPNNPEVVENLRHQFVFTVDQLAGLTDSQIQGIGIGGRGFVARAKAMLDMAAGGKEFSALQRQLDTQGGKLQELTARNAALEEELRKYQERERSAGGVDLKPKK